eukprot:CAMPEP_0202078852 /NCGR_PEP_ID=MMETSP0964-20121228/6157_1 /ASSEMBLY_ACC=CAM_ASM_000500 /TAXON_ID=4773 /ORGANISM="Schizochytrium aggregatum, Strain ATCC28209" /LENGTH=313 /DNA_ID=CAMNT_0048646165 /DNA_START=21 /DNA_END=962 /DNA_ORIENTATION=+
MGHIHMQSPHSLHSSDLPAPVFGKSGSSFPPPPLPPPGQQLSGGDDNFLMPMGMDFVDHTPMPMVLPPVGAPGQHERNAPASATTEDRQPPPKPKAMPSNKKPKAEPVPPFAPAGGAPTLGVPAPSPPMKATSKAAGAAKPAKSRSGKLSPEQTEVSRQQRLSQRRMRKSAREKERRSLENDLFEELARLVGLPQDKRDKATVLEAVIDAIKDEYGDELTEDQMNENLSNLYAMFGHEMPNSSANNGMAPTISAAKASMAGASSLPMAGGAAGQVAGAPPGGALGGHQQAPQPLLGPHGNHTGGPIKQEHVTY